MEAEVGGDPSEHDQGVGAVVGRARALPREGRLQQDRQQRADRGHRRDQARHLQEPTASLRVRQGQHRHHRHHARGRQRDRHAGVDRGLQEIPAPRGGAEGAQLDTGVW